MKPQIGEELKAEDEMPELGMNEVSRPKDRLRSIFELKQHSQEMIDQKSIGDDEPAQLQHFDDHKI